MVSKKVITNVVRIKLGDGLQERWCTSDNYVRIVQACLGQISDHTYGYENPQECDLLSDDFRDLLSNIFKKGGKRYPDTLIIDFSSVQSSIERYSDYCDDICTELRHRIDQISKAVSSHVDLIIIVSDLLEFRKSITLKERLEKSCVSKETGLVIIEVSDEPKAHIVYNSGRLLASCEENINSLQKTVKTDTDEICDEDLIRSQADEIFGHFEVSSVKESGSLLFKSHVTTLLSLERCLNEDKLIPFLHDIIKRELECDNFTIASIGLQSADLEVIAKGIVNNDLNRFGLNRSLDDRKVAILCDILWNAYDLEGIVSMCRRKGAADIYVVGFGSYKGFTGSFRYQSFIEIDGREYKLVDNSCPFCKYDVPLLNYEYLDGYLAEIGKYHPYEFWEEVGNVPGAYIDGHWESERTGYHYLHQIRCKPLFNKYGYGMAIRIRNLLMKHIFTHWIDVLLCPDDEEAVIFTEQIKRSLKTSHIESIIIPRKYFGVVTGNNIPSELNDNLKNKYGDNPLDKKNVIIVDQAAHHFGTLTALSHVCQFLGGRILAFIVAIDRLHPNTLVSDLLPNSHYLSLYRWPWPPFKSDQCPCAHGLL